MPRGKDPGDAPVSPADLIRQLTAAISGGGTGGLPAALQHLTGTAMPGAELFAVPPSRRRPRRPDVVAYRVRVDLKGTKPPLWRRLELASDIFLDEVHEVIQAAFGWTDSHLHQFGSGPQYYGPETEYYLCPFQVEEGEVGVPEEEVRLDEVLAEPGDKLFYLYDFGDDWEHVIKLEATVRRDDTAPGAVCLDGRRDGPPEDCGGVDGYELISAAIDPASPEHADAVAEYERRYGGEFDPGGTTPFDIDYINAVLAEMAPPGASPGSGNPPDELSGPLDELVQAVRESAPRRELRRLAGAALAVKPDIDAPTAARMVRPYAWLMDRVGTDGIRLTGAGYLPPADVAAASAELDLAKEWIGKGNREIQTLPVLRLRETATKMGLLRKHRGMLLLTAVGRKLRADPVALWWHLAERMPVKSADRCETQAGLIWLLAVAAQADDPDEIVARMLGAIGWTLDDGAMLDATDAARAAWDARNVLKRLGGMAEDPRGYGRGTPTADGVAFARAAVSTWPTAGR